MEFQLRQLAHYSFISVCLYKIFLEIRTIAMQQQKQSSKMHVLRVQANDGTIGVSAADNTCLSPCNQGEADTNGSLSHLDSQHQ